MVEKSTSWREKKLELLEWLVQVEDESVLEKLNDIRSGEIEKREQLYSDYLKERVLASEKDISEGRLISHEKVKEDFLNGKI